MLNSRENLKKYREKRDFNRTTEPGEGKGGLRWTTRCPIFFIQKHDASNLHHDFRIEIDGVLKSWAVPKGTFTDSSKKCLAMPTEDHPLEHANFEGTIPEGEYGGGAVRIWDHGRYRNLKKDEAVSKSGSQKIEDAHVTIWLESHKLKGSYALIRTGTTDKARWLLIKMNDEEADPRRDPNAAEPNSVKTGCTPEEIREYYQK